MRFLHPEYIYLMLVPAFVLVYLISTNKDTLERIFDERILERLRIRGDALGRAGHNTLLFFVFFMMTVALAGPVIEKRDRMAAAPGFEIVIAIDDSAVMRQSDLTPDRFEFAKMKISRLLSRIEGVPVGLIAFDRGADLVAPPTTDRDTLRVLLERLKPKKSSVADPAAAMYGGLEVLRNQKHKLLIIVRADEKIPHPTRLAERVRQEGLRVVIWRMASHKERESDTAAIVAKESGGLALWASTTSDRDIGKLTHYLQTLIEHYPGGVRWVPQRIELFYIPLILALLAIPFAIYSIGSSGLESWLVVVLLLGSFPNSARAGLFDFIDLKKATQAYERGDYRTAADRFEKAVMASPRPETWYALGNSYYKSGRWKMACDAYSRVVTTDPRLEAAKLYNLGNCYVKLGELQKAAKFYRKVLKIWDDPDAAYNLKIVTHALKMQRPKRPRDEAIALNAESSEKKRGVIKNRRVREKVEENLSDIYTPAEERKYMKRLAQKPIRLKLYRLVPPTEKEL